MWGWQVCTSCRWPLFSTCIYLYFQTMASLVTPGTQYDTSANQPQELHRASVVPCLPI